MPCIPYAWKYHYRQQYEFCCTDDPGCDVTRSAVRVTPERCGTCRLCQAAEVTHEAGMFRIRLMQLCRVCAARVARREWRGGLSGAGGPGCGRHVGFPTRAVTTGLLARYRTLYQSAYQSWVLWGTARCELYLSTCLKRKLRSSCCLRTSFFICSVREYFFRKINQFPTLACPAFYRCTMWC